MKPSNPAPMLANPLRDRVAVLLALALALTLASVGRLPVDAQESDTYTWSAELLAVDERAGTITVRSRLVTEADAEAIAAMPSGRATLVWSGMNWAAGVRRILRGEPAPEDHLTLPIELVAGGGDDRYVRFKVAVPKADIERIRPLVAGGWVTATSPRRASGNSVAVTSVRPYSDAG